MALVFLVASGAAAQQGSGEQPAQSEPPNETIDQSALSARIAELQAIEQRDAMAEDELSDLLRTRELLEQTATLRVEARKHDDEARTVPAQAAQIDEYLAKTVEELLPAIDPQATIEQLQSLLEQARTSLANERSARLQVDADSAFRTKRRAEIPAERQEAETKLSAALAKLSTPPNPDDSASRANAKHLLALAERNLAQAILEKLDKELANYDARRPLLDKRKLYRDRRVEVAQRTVTALETEIGRKQAEAARLAEEQAARERAAAINDHPLVRAIVDQNAEYARAATEIADWNQRDISRKQEIDSLHEVWQEALTRAQNRAKRNAYSGELGVYLRNQLRRMPDVTAFRREAKTLAAHEVNVYNKISQWEDARESLIDLDAEVARLLDESSAELPTNEADLKQLRSSLAEALNRQKQYLDDLSNTASDYSDHALLDLRSSLGSFIEELDRFQTFIAERILWIRSADPLNTGVFSSMGEAVVWLVQPTTWEAIYSALRSDAQTSAALYIGAVLLAIAFLVGRVSLRRQLSELARKTERNATLRFSLTLRALLITAILAAFWPALIWFCAWRVGVSAEGNTLAVALNTGLNRTAVLLLAMLVLYDSCRADGLADAHFGWLGANLKLVRRHLRWFIPVVAPLALLVGVTEAVDDYHESLGRAAFIVGLVALAYFAFRLCHPTRGFPKSFIAMHQGGWVDRLRYVWFGFLVCAPLALAIAAAFGYFYTALQLERRLIDTTWMMLIIVLARAVLLRWVWLEQRRIGLEQARRRLQERKASESGEIESSVDSSSPSVPESVEIDLTAVSMQTKKLLNTAVAFFVALVVLVTWYDVLPAFRALDNVTLWSDSTVSQVETAAGSNVALRGGVGLAGVNGTEDVGGGSGSDAVAATDQVNAPADSTAGSASVTAVTLADLLMSILIVVVTWIVAQNIPGVLEITILQHLPITHSGRYAVSTIVRYVILLLGIIIAFNAIGIGWSKVQFLAAAFTVGLGFGLQEIFANFVSGIIILFERPIRVGDTVTIGDVSGQVTRVRMRATTILDFNRKETVIPNKEFVTGRVMNWTLSDSVLRVTIPVGIAYGSDVERARSILLDVANKSEHVVLDPPPQALFQGFGASSLDFELRVFVQSIEWFVLVKDRLNSAIDAAFREAGIEIAFPQQDLHIRSVEGVFLHREAPGDVKDSKG